MKKLRFPIAFMVATFILGGCGGSQDSKVMVDGKKVEFSHGPEVVDGVLMVPGEQLFRILYGEPVWDEESKTMGIQDHELLFLLQANNVYANLNDAPYLLPMAPSLQGSELMVPLEAVALALGHRVQWEGSTASIITDVRTVELSQREALLVGTWSDNNRYFGEMYDPGTGLPITSAYSGKWYVFSEDGTFCYIIAGSGQFISGVAMDEGKYKLEGDELVLYSQTSSWAPDLARSDQAPSYKNKPIEDERLTLIFEGLDTIRINGDTYYLHNPQHKPTQ
jgi:hypothetical protein